MSEDPRMTKSKKKKNIFGESARSLAREEITTERETTRGIKRTTNVVDASHSLNHPITGTSGTSTTDSIPTSKFPTTATDHGASRYDQEGHDFGYAYGNTTQGTTQNEYLRQFLEHRDLILETILKNEALPSIPKCMNCHIKLARWRCSVCKPGLFCRACCRVCHQAHPFHHIKRWNGTFFEQASLHEAGVKIYLGHGGLPCPKDDSTLQQLAKEDMLDDKRTQEALESYGHPNEQDWTGLDFFSGIGSGQDEPGMTEDPDDDDDTEDTVEDTEITTKFCPTQDAQENLFMVVVHSTGIFGLPVVTCGCRSEPVFVQCLKQDFMPGSFKEPRTLFTFELLDYNRMSNVEGHLSCYQETQILRRITNPAFPHLVPNRYTELRRVSRQWRNLLLLKWNGYGIRRHSEATGASSPDLQRPGPGDLALFCAACPQPGINLPLDWKTQYTQNEVMRSLVVDGNFTADHLRQKKAKDDVWLMEGQAMMTAQAPYKQHLAVAVDTKEEDPCDNSFKAVNNANMGPSTIKDATGIVGHACGRHGCYVPRSIVDLQKGERQANVDYSFKECIHGMNLNGIEKILHIYDIECQYYKHLAAQIEKNPHLKEPLERLGFDHVLLEKAIGAFHVHGHKEQCLYRFATLFIPGAGMIDGEILETLWSILNDISRCIRTSTLAHRAEVLDDHMIDSNWKKLVGIVARIIQKYLRAIDNIGPAEEYWQQLWTNAGAEFVRIWTKEIESAEKVRIQDPQAMDIMRPNVDELHGLEKTVDSLMAADTPGITARISWIRSGLRIEKQQAHLRYLVWKAGSRPSSEDKIAIAKKRETITGVINRFRSLADRFMGLLAMEMFDDNGMGQAGELEQMEDTDGEDLPAIVGLEKRIKNTRIPLPSAFEMGKWGELEIEEVAWLELNLRIGWANDILRTARTQVGHKSLIYAKVVRNAQTKRTGQRSQAPVKQINQTLDHIRRMYTHNRKAMLALGMATQSHLRDRYQVLERQDLSSGTAVADPNARGQSQGQLSWIWTVDVDPTAAHNKDYLTEFFRVHWMRARARYLRWKEEVTLTKNEMEWVVRYFRYRSRQWTTWGSSPQLHAGMVAYAHRQSNMWRKFEIVAEHRFVAVRPEFTICYSFITGQSPDKYDGCHNEIHLYYRFLPIAMDAQKLIHSVYYFTARLRHVLSYPIPLSNKQDRLWFEKGVEAELKLVLRALGCIRSQGTPINVPILITEICTVLKDPLVLNTGLVLDFFKTERGIRILCDVPSWDPSTTHEKYDFAWWLGPRQGIQTEQPFADALNAYVEKSRHSPAIIDYMRGKSYTEGTKTSTEDLQKQLDIIVSSIKGAKLAAARDKFILAKRESIMGLYGTFYNIHQRPPNDQERVELVEHFNTITGTDQPTHEEQTDIEGNSVQEESVSSGNLESSHSGDTD